MQDSHKKLAAIRKSSRMNTKNFGTKESTSTLMAAEDQSDYSALTRLTKHTNFTKFGKHNKNDMNSSISQMIAPKRISCSHFCVILSLLLLAFLVLFIVLWITAALVTPQCPSYDYFGNQIEFIDTPNDETWYVTFANQGNFLVPYTNETTCVSQDIQQGNFSLEYTDINNNKITKNGHFQKLPRDNILQYVYDNSNEASHNFKVVDYQDSSGQGFLMMYHCEHSLLGIGRYESFIISSKSAYTSK